MITNKIRQEIFSSLPCVDGRGSIKDWNGKLLDQPWTQEYRDSYVRDLYNNSCVALKHGILQPVTESHEDKDPHLKGQATAFYLAYRTSPVPHVVLIADMVVDDELFTTLEAGKLPGCSAEIAPYADLSAYGGGWMGDYVCAVTYNGSEPVAQPFNQRLDPDLEELGVAYVYQFKRLSKPRIFSLPPSEIGEKIEPTPPPKGDKDMTPDEIKAIIVAAVAEEVAKAIAGMEKADMAADSDAAAAAAAEAEKAKMAANAGATAPDATADAIAAMKAEFAALKASIQVDAGKTAFAALGLDEKTHKANFDELASKAGVDFAVKHFSALKVSLDSVEAVKKQFSAQKPAAPIGTMIPDKDGKQTFQIDKSHPKFAATRAITKSDAEAVAILTKLAERELAAAGAN
jgi:hypothetical protein